MIEKQLKTCCRYTGNIIQVYEDQVLLPNGKEARREVVYHPGAVVLAAFLDPQTLLLVRQYRYPIGQVLLELPAGKLEIGDTDPEMRARRELIEETGYDAQRFTFLYSFYTAPGFCDECLYCFKVEQLFPAQNPIIDEDETIECVPFTIKEAQEALQQGQIIDAKTLIILWQWISGNL